jgi:hypothetical protein
VALGVAVAAVADHPSTAAIVALAITIGTWILDLAAAIHGGVWEQLAGYTPSAMVASFQRGLLQTSVTAVVLVIALAGFSIGAVWLTLAMPVRRRVAATVAIAAVTSLAVAAAAYAPGAWDLSESRQNSFSTIDETWLKRIKAPIAAEVHLAPQDPRRLPLDRGPLAKLRRALPQLRVRYMSQTSTGLYEQQDPAYGQVRFSSGGRENSTRVFTDAGVLEAVYGLVGLETDEDLSTSSYSGHPLTAQPTGAGWVFYVAWPLTIAVLYVLATRRSA